MKKVLLASVLAIASFPGYAAEPHPNDIIGECGELENSPPCPPDAKYERDRTPHVTVAPPYQGPPPIGWVYAPYTRCAVPVPVSPGCVMGVIVDVPAEGLNVRTVPNGPPIMALVNGTPLWPVTRQGNWLLVAAGCDLTPTWAWSWTAGVPLNRCWVYF
jgi:hypothetical protein